MKHDFKVLRRQLERRIVGQAQLVERLLIAVLTGGHLLLEGVPGLAKTTAVRALAGGLALRFQRIQFTPDLIPGDITGTDIFIPREERFQFVAGPIFGDIILADEINRAPPKVQSALLEAMQEHQVTVGGATRSLPDTFLVIATQNPIELEGTYPLPEAQLDRFLMKVRIDYPSADEELQILHMAQERLAGRQPEPAEQPALTPAEVRAARAAVNGIYLDEMLERYIVTLVGATRNPAPWDAEIAERITRGASPRATLALAHAARARALLYERDFVDPGDILELAPDVLTHRITPSFAARAAGLTSAALIERILAKVPIP